MPNPSATITNPDDSVRVVLVGADGSEIQRTVTGTVTVSNYAAAYVAKSGTAYFVKPNASVFPIAPGSSMVVTASFNCLDAAGTPLPPAVVDVILQGPPLPPVATHLNITEGPTTGRFPVLSDPGSATINF